MQKELLEDAKQEIEILWGNTAEGKHIKTGDIRKLSGKLFRRIIDKNIENVFSLCEEFLEQRTWELGVIAFDWAYKMQKNYTADVYPVFYDWLKKYVRGWGIAMTFVRMLLGSFCYRISSCLQMLFSGQAIMIFGCVGLQQLY